MGQREHRGCFRLLLTQVAGIYWTHELEQQAITSLEDPDGEVAAEAAKVLAAHGGPAVEHYLWKRLEVWNEKWRGREKELRSRPAKSVDEAPDDGGLGAELMTAIWSARAWYMDEDRRTRLITLSVEERTRKVWTQESTGPVRVEVANGSPIYGKIYRVAQYTLPTFEALKAKMAQFPTDTTFRWCPQVDPFDVYSPEDRQEMYIDLARFLSARQMRIEQYPKAGCAP